METNMLLGTVLMLTGVADIMFARFLGARMSAQARTLISVFGAAFIVLGSLLSLGFFKIV